MRVFIGGSRDERAAAVRAYAASLPPLREIHAARHWPFLRHVMPPIQPPAFGGPATLWLRDLHLAFPPPRTPAVRCVLTQSTYQLQRVLDALRTNPAYVVIADADNRLRSEVAGARGPWARIEITDLGAGGPSMSLGTGREGADHESAREFDDVPASAPALLLHRAIEALEAQDLGAARGLIEEALRLDPEWEAAHFELGKVCLWSDDTEGAAAAFAEAGRLMPTLAAAYSNLGAALGEMDRPDEALAALQQALSHDPNGFPVLNNIGAVHRDAGRLREAEEAFRQVLTLAPSFVFGHYNLGHTLFLAGRFDEARAAYEAGYERDAQKNARQACRLAVARAASGDGDGAAGLIDSIGSAVPSEVMRELAAEVEMTLDGGLKASVYPARSAAACEAALAAVRRYTS
jgi:tetratricopeptide (TPR) repeat protein